MQQAPSGNGLARLYTRWLAALFITLELITAAAVLGFIMLPMSERAADDLAGLMVLSAQTWTELPPETRPVFEAELARGYQIALRPSMLPAPDTGLRHGLYIRFLELAFERRLGQEAFFLREVAADGSDWLWIAIPAGGRSVGMGFAINRLQTNPFAVLAAALAAGMLLVGALAWWLASRIAQPVARFELAAAQLAKGAHPDLLPETGPRELAALAHHFNRMALQVRELSDARTTLFAGLSHDLRTPLARMRLALEMLTLKPEPALLLRLELDIEEMNRLIGQLLEIARGLRPEAGQALDLCAWLQARTQVHRAAADAAGASLIVRCPGDLRAIAAPDMLARILDNLLGNALRYAPGPIELVGQAVSQAAGKPVHVRIGVLDRGPAIPHDQLDAVFRPFHRIEGSANPVAGGFGLGLAIVRQLAQANGWGARLERREGGGLAAWVELPAPCASGLAPSQAACLR
ncbi:MAG: ATP-binding protein [Rubrivivax sp.]|nr:ATP-binding protein [Rubrivivax sp.]